MRLGGLIRGVVAALCIAQQAVAAPVILLSPDAANGSDLIEAALQRARAVPGSTIALAPGTYRLSRTLHLGAADAGTRIVGQGVAVLTGAAPLPAADLPAALAARAPAAARTHLRAYRLPDAMARAFASEQARSPARTHGATLMLMQGSAPLQLAGWPDKGYAVQPVSSPQPGPNIRPVIVVPPDKAGWFAETALRIGGYFTFDWFYEAARIASADHATNSLRVAPLGGSYAEIKTIRYRILNALAEIDRPGEYFIDPDQGLVIAWPLSAAPLEAAMLDDVVAVTGAKDIVFDGVALRGAARDALSIDGSSRISFVNGYLGIAARNGATVRGGDTVSIGRSVIADVGETGVYLGGGDQATMRRGGNRVYDSRFARFATLMRTYRPGVHLSGVGNSVSGCYFADAPHSAILFEGNDHRIAGNEIVRSNRETGDAAAIYTGASLTSRGNEIVGNYLHDLRRQPGLPEVAGIYIDGFSGGQTIRGNLVADAHLGVWINGGNDNFVTDNVFVRPVQVGLFLRDSSHTYDRGAGINARRSLDTITYSIAHRYGKKLTGLRHWDGIPRGNRFGPNVTLGGKSLDISPGLAPRQTLAPQISGPAPPADSMAVIAHAVRAIGARFALPFDSMPRRAALESLRYGAFASTTNEPFGSSANYLAPIILAEDMSTTPVNAYRGFVEMLRRDTGMTPEVLHITMGLLLWLLAALLLRRPLRSPVPLAIVVAVAIANEVMDRLFWGEWRPDTVTDLVYTFAWPTILTVALARLPWLRA